MKKYLIIFLCLVGYLNGAELVKREPREWIAEAYANGNESQITCFRYWLHKYNIETKDKNIISFGCGTGEIEAELAKNANHVHGIDASKNQVEFAQKRFENVPKLSFQHCFAEDFSSPRLHDLAIASCCFHWFTDKKLALKRIYDSLEVGGQFFANIKMANNPIPFDITVFEEMKADIPIIGRLLSAISNPTGSSRMTDNELKNLFNELGFEIIKEEEESYDWTKTEEQWGKYQLPILLSTPGAQALINMTSKENWCTNFVSESAYSYLIEGAITEAEKAQHAAPFFPESTNELVQHIRDNNFCKYLFNNFLNRCLKKFHDNGDGTYTYKYVTTIILAKKIKNIPHEK